MIIERKYLFANNTKQKNSLCNYKARLRKKQDFDAFIETSI